MRHNLRSSGGTETALAADFRRKAKLASGKTRKPVDRFTTANETRRQDSGSPQQVSQGTGFRPSSSSSRQGSSSGVKSKAEREAFPPCPHCGKVTHLAKLCWFRPDIKCRSCNQLGHVEKVCKSKQGKAQQQQSNSAEEHHEELYVVSHMESALVAQRADVWLLDSGCTNTCHLTLGSSGT